MQTVTVVIEGKEYTGRYKYDNELIFVESNYGNKGTQVGGHRGYEETLARLLLSELVRAHLKR